MNPILTVKNLSVSFRQYSTGLQRRRLDVIRGLSLEVEAGQVVAMVGASGSGKSLLAHAILGLLPYNAQVAGELFYDGQRLDRARTERLRGREIALIPQGVTYLDPLMRVGPQLDNGSRARQAAQKRRQALARYGLSPQTEELYPFELSGGMARRVLIAAAVLQEARLIIADEPTPGLDAGAAGRILGRLRELAAAGAGVLFITHDLELALAAADRVAVLYAGETVEEAASGDFAAGRLRHPYTQALWNALPQNGFLPLEGTQPYPEEMASGCRFAPRCPQCEPRCKAAEVPYRPCRGGYVRCVRAEEEKHA